MRTLIKLLKDYCFGMTFFFGAAAGLLLGIFGNPLAGYTAIVATFLMCGWLLAPFADFKEYYRRVFGRPGVLFVALSAVLFFWKGVPELVWTPAFIFSGFVLSLIFFVVLSVALLSVPNQST